MNKRQHALHELLSSERAYASDLALIRDVHIPLARGLTNPLTDIPTPRHSSSGSSLRTLSTSLDSSTSSLGLPMTQEDTKLIFRNITELALFSDMFAEDLELAMGAVIEGGLGEDAVGELFVRIVPDLERPYKLYITGHSTALQHLEALPKTPALTSYLAYTQTVASSLSHAWDLASLLIKPVQRLLAYPLLLSAIIDETPDAHPDRENLRTARTRMEEVVRNVNEARRRSEVVKEVLSSKTLKKAGVSVTLSASVNLPKMSLRLGSVTATTMKVSQLSDSGSEAAQVETYQAELRRIEVFAQQFARDVVGWGKMMARMMGALRVWALSFGKVIGLSREQGSEAFEAFLEVITKGLLPLSADLELMLNERLLRDLAHLLTTMNKPLKLLASMNEQESFHYHLLTTPISARTRLSPSALAASTNYLALRGQLAAELPIHLSLMHRGLSALVPRLVRVQTRWWDDVRNRWGELWEFLRVEGELNVGCAETVAVWCARWADVDEVVRGLGVVSQSPGVLVQQVMVAQALRRAGTQRQMQVQQQQQQQERQYTMEEYFAYPKFFVLSSPQYSPPRERERDKDKERNRDEDKSRDRHNSRSSGSSPNTGKATAAAAATATVQTMFAAIAPAQSPQSPSAYHFGGGAGAGGGASAYGASQMMFGGGQASAHSVYAYGLGRRSASQDSLRSRRWEERERLDPTQREREGLRRPSSRNGPGTGMGMGRRTHGHPGLADEFAVQQMLGGYPPSSPRPRTKSMPFGRIASTYEKERGMGMDMGLERDRESTRAAWTGAGASEKAQAQAQVLPTTNGAIDGDGLFYQPPSAPASATGRGASAGAEEAWDGHALVQRQDGGPESAYSVSAMYAHEHLGDRVRGERVRDRESERRGRRRGMMVDADVRAMASGLTGAWGSSGWTGTSGSTGAVTVTIERTSSQDTLRSKSREEKERGRLKGPSSRSGPAFGLNTRVGLADECWEYLQQMPVGSAYEPTGNGSGLLPLRPGTSESKSMPALASLLPPTPSRGTSPSKRMSKEGLMQERQSSHTSNTVTSYLTASEADSNFNRNVFDNLSSRSTSTISTSAPPDPQAVSSQRNSWVYEPALLPLYEQQPKSNMEEYFAFPEFFVPSSPHMQSPTQYSPPREREQDKDREREKEKDIQNASSEVVPLMTNGGGYIVGGNKLFYQPPPSGPATVLTTSMGIGAAVAEDASAVPVQGQASSSASTRTIGKDTSSTPSTPRATGLTPIPRPASPLSPKPSRGTSPYKRSSRERATDERRPVEHIPPFFTASSMRSHAVNPLPPPDPQTFTPSQRDSWGSKPAKYVCQAVHPCKPPAALSYYSFPFFTLLVDDLYEVLQEAGPPSIHPKLPLYVDDGDDCLLLCRDGNGVVGWALASFLEPLEVPVS